VYVCVYLYICMYVGVHVCVCTCGMHEWVHVWACYVCMLIPLPLCVFGCVLQRLRTRSRSKLGNMRFRLVFIMDLTLAIQRPTHGMIQRSVPVRAVKTRRRFRFKITSFHVSVWFCVIFLFTIVNKFLCFTCIISYDQLTYFTSMITCITSWDISERSL